MFSSCRGGRSERAVRFGADRCVHRVVYPSPLVWHDGAGAPVRSLKGSSVRRGWVTCSRFAAKRSSSRSSIRAVLNLLPVPQFCRTQLVSPSCCHSTTMRETATHPHFWGASPATGAMTANKNASAKLRRRREWWAQQLQRRAQLADTHCARCQAPAPAEHDPLVPATPGSALRVVMEYDRHTDERIRPHDRGRALVCVSA